MYLNIEIGPYKVSQRTEFSKIKIFNTKENKDLSDTEDGPKIAEKIISDYEKQTKNPDAYYKIKNGTLTKCDDSAMKNIEYAFIPENVTTLSSNVFEYLPFKQIHLPESLKVIESFAFFCCTNLEEISIPHLVVNIKEDTFKDCVRLKSINISDNVKNIFSHAFAGCLLLEEVNLSNNLYSIGMCAFSGCCKLKEISLPDGLYFIDEKAFENCGLKEIIIPDSVKKIRNMAFANCKKLEYVKIPDMSELNEGMFLNCENLKDIKMPETIFRMYNDVFAGAKKIKNINIPQELGVIYDSTFKNSQIESLTFNHKFTKLQTLYWSGEDYDLVSNSNISKLIISNCVGYIAPEAFRYAGDKITAIDYQGTKEEFEEFRKNNEKLFNLFNSLKEINFIDDKEKDNIAIFETER